MEGPTPHPTTPQCPLCPGRSLGDETTKHLVDSRLKTQMSTLPQTSQPGTTRTTTHTTHTHNNAHHYRHHHRQYYTHHCTQPTTHTHTTAHRPLHAPVHTHTHTHTYQCTHTHTHTNTPVHTHTHTQTPLHTHHCTHTTTHTHHCTHTPLHTPVHTHTMRTAKQEQSKKSGERKLLRDSRAVLDVFRSVDKCSNVQLRVRSQFFPSSLPCIRICAAPPTDHNSPTEEVVSSCPNYATCARCFHLAAHTRGA